jgi:hypothetical protein
MQIRARMSRNGDGDVTAPAGWPAVAADPAFVSGESHGIEKFLAGAVPGGAAVAAGPDLPHV